MDNILLATKHLVVPTGMPVSAAKYGTTLVKGDWEDWWKVTMEEARKVRHSPAPAGSPDVLFYFPELPRARIVFKGNLTVP